MPRIHAWLSLSLLIVLVGVAGVGWLAPGASSQRHVALAIFTLLLSCFIQVLGFTYLTVTAKVVAQMVHLGRLETSYVRCCQQIKKRFSRALGVLALCIVLVTATGAARWSGWGDGTWHLLAGFAAVAAHIWAMAMQYALVSENAALLTEVTAAYANQKAVFKAAAGAAQRSAR